MGVSNEKLPRLAYRPEEAAKIAGVGRSTIYNALHDGTLRAHRKGTRWIITTEALRDWVDA